MAFVEHKSARCKACGGMIEHGDKSFVKEEEGSGYEKHKYAKGGMAGYEHEEEAAGFEPMPHEAPEHHYDHAEENQSNPYGMQLMHRIMKAKGGVIANEDEPMVDDEPAEYDDMEVDDHMEPHMEPDGPGDEEEDMDRRDIVKRLVKSGKKTDRNPRPA